MTLDFLQDFKEACAREGVHYLVIFSTDKAESFHYHHNMDELPPYVDYPDGCRRTRMEDVRQLVETINFSPEDDE